VPHRTLRVLHSFGESSDGANPFASLTRDSQGNLYGTTEYGGASGAGTVFKLDTAGNETILVSFNGSNGAYPLSNLVQDSSGNLYGTTFSGGDLNCGGGGGCGEVFKVDPSGNETVLYAFTGTGGDGANPALGLAQDSAGNLYGATQDGGNATSCNSKFLRFGCGTVFKIDPSGTETVLYSFTGSDGDGAAPFGGVIVDGSGNIFGTTWQGGSYKRELCKDNNKGGCGTVFELDSTGHETVLHDFSGSIRDGSGPQTQLVTDVKGDIYGVTLWGGKRHCKLFLPGCGTVFNVDANGAYTVLYRFRGRIDGNAPQGPLTLDQEGNLYGAAGSGGKYGQGGIFELTTAGQLSSIFFFTGDKAEPKNPNGGLILDAEGNIYGTTLHGGDYHGGAIFEIKH